MLSPLLRVHSKTPLGLGLMVNFFNVTRSFSYDSYDSYINKYNDEETDSDDEMCENESQTVFDNKHFQDKVIHTVESFKELHVADKPVYPLDFDILEALSQGLLSNFQEYSVNPQDYTNFAKSTIVVESSYTLAKNQLIRTPSCHNNGFFVGHSSWNSTKYVACTFHNVCPQVNEYEYACDSEGLYFNNTGIFEIQQSEVGVKWNRDILCVWSPSWFDPTQKHNAKIVCVDIKKDIALLEIENYQSTSFMQLGEFACDPSNVVAVGMLFLCYHIMF